jgi:hypothetical protein
MGDLLGQHPQIRSFVEPRPLFDLVTQAAIDESVARQSLPQILEEYDRLFEISAPLHCADKSHPALWIAEALAAHFPNARFIGMSRDAAPTVASMLRHSGVRRWCEEWRKYPSPNRFLGITLENADWYSSASLIQRCVARWWSHRQELLRLQSILGNRIVLLRYEDLVSSPENTLTLVERLIGLDEPFPAATPQRQSLAKWKNQLSSAEAIEIEQTVCLLDPWTARTSGHPEAVSELVRQP